MFQGVGFWVPISVFRLQRSGIIGLRAWLFRLMVQGFWFLVSGLWFMVQGFEFMVLGHGIWFSCFIACGFHLSQFPGL
jgi:hypothetical protein